MNVKDIYLLIAGESALVGAEALTILQEQRERLSDYFLNLVKMEL